MNLYCILFIFLKLYIIHIADSVIFIIFASLNNLIYVDMEILNFKDGQLCYLVFEGNLHHSIYFDLQNCLFHYDWLLNHRDSKSHFEIYEMIFDSDMNSFKPNGLFCSIYKNHKVCCSCQSSAEQIASISTYFNIMLITDSSIEYISPYLHYE